jgi:hypothetical protein
MGNVVAGSALRKGAGVGNYAMLHAAVPASCYDIRDELKQEPVFGGPLDGYVYWSNARPDADNDIVTRLLAYRGQLTHVNGNLINFYLPGDRATTYAWEFNTNVLKPAAGFQYDPAAPDGGKLWKTEHLILKRPLTEPEEAMPFADQSWSKVAGAEARTAGVLNNVSVDLNAEFSFGDNHSAEFEESIQQLQLFYSRLLDRLVIPHN